MFGDKQDQACWLSLTLHKQTHPLNTYTPIEGISHELSKGSHMYLFAIKLPFVNYPPSIHSSYVEHHIEYTLQAFLDVEDDHAPSCIESACVPIMYLPFVTCIPLPGSNRPQHGAKNTQTFKCENAEVEVAAELVKPAYCPGTK